MADSRFGDYVIGLAGVALLRSWLDGDAETHRSRLIDLVNRSADDELLSFEFPTPEAVLA